MAKDTSKALSDALAAHIEEVKKTTVPSTDRKSIQEIKSFFDFLTSRGVSKSVASQTIARIFHGAFWGGIPESEEPSTEAQA